MGTSVYYNFHIKGQELTISSQASKPHHKKSAHRSLSTLYHGLRTRKEPLDIHTYAQIHEVAKSILKGYDDKLGCLGKFWDAIKRFFFNLVTDRSRIYELFNKIIQFPRAEIEPEVAGSMINTPTVEPVEIIHSEEALPPSPRFNSLEFQQFENQENSEQLENKENDILAKFLALREFFKNKSAELFKQDDLSEDHVDFLMRSLKDIHHIHSDIFSRYYHQIVESQGDEALLNDPIFQNIKQTEKYISEVFGNIANMYIHYQKLDQALKAALCINFIECRKKRISLIEEIVQGYIKQTCWGKAYQAAKTLESDHRPEEQSDILIAIADGYYQSGEQALAREVISHVTITELREERLNKYFPEV